MSSEIESGKYERKKMSFMIGYSFIIHSFLMYWIQGIMTTSGNNIFIPYFVNNFGWERTTILNWLTVAAFTAVFGATFFAQMVKKFGPRKVTVITLLVGGVFTVLFGRVSVLGIFIGVSVVIFIFAQGWAGVTTNTLITNWYPRRKAIILGITTMGLPFASIAFVPTLNYLVNNISFPFAYLCVGILMIIIGIASIFWVKDNPEDVGLSPDNDDLTEAQMKNAVAKLKNFQSQWSLGKLLRDRNAWLLVIAFGVMFMCNKGMIGQMVYYFIDKGFDQPQAILFISRISFCGLAGSYIWGFIDDRIGTKQASVLYGFIYGLGFFLMFLGQANAVMWIGVIIFEFCMGGIGNLIPSMIVTCYGRYEFPTVNRLLNPIIATIYALANWSIGFSADIMGGTGRAPVVYAALVVICALLIIAIKPNPRKDLDYNTPVATEGDKR
ncbi:MAG: MFS transporter [Clostridiales Family XIII bacterium]|jgi:sugar phosphate permease|nr:MFS transporter [Clostridiales Family XIII bacterium]